MKAVKTITGAAQLGLELTNKLAFIASLATRIVIGLAYFQTGLGKWQHFDRTVQFFASSGIPFPTFNVALVATLELIGGPLLIAGLMTRLTASALSASMVVALLTADRASFLAAWKPGAESGPTDVTAFVFLLFLLWLALIGPGAVSVDRWMRGRLEKCGFPKEFGRSR
jgi:putative oxidoreductase